MVKAMGVGILTFDDGRIIERDTIRCAHCQRVVRVKPGTFSTVYRVYDPATRQWSDEPGAFCRNCMAPICPWCDTTGTCAHFMRAIEASEARQRLRAQVG